MATQEDELLTVAEAARLLRVTPHTIYRWISAERLPAVRYSSRVLRIRRRDLESFGGSDPALKEAGVPYSPGASTRILDEEERKEIERFFKRYEELRDRPRPAGAPPKGSVEALFQ